MEPSIITAIILGSVSVASIIGASVVALCRKKKESIDDAEKASSDNKFDLELGPTETITTKTDGTIIKNKSDGLRITVTAADHGDGSSKRNTDEEGYDKNPVPVVIPDGLTVAGSQGRSGTGLAAAGTGADAHSEAASASDHPTQTDHTLSRTVSSKFGIASIEIIRSDGTRVKINGVQSIDSRSNNNESNEGSDSALPPPPPQPQHIHLHLQGGVTLGGAVNGQMTLLAGHQQGDDAVSEA